MSLHHAVWLTCLNLVGFLIEGYFCFHFAWTFSYYSRIFVSVALCGRAVFCFCLFFVVAFFFFFFLKGLFHGLLLLPTPTTNVTAPAPSLFFGLLHPNPMLQPPHPFLQPPHPSLQPPHPSLQPLTPSSKNPPTSQLPASLLLTSTGSSPPCAPLPQPPLSPGLFSVPACITVVLF